VKKEEAGISQCHNLRTSTYYIQVCLMISPRESLKTSDAFSFFLFLSLARVSSPVSRVISAFVLAQGRGYFFN